MDLTKKQTVADIAERWREQYSNHGIWKSIYSFTLKKSAKVHYDEMLAISDINDLDAVDAIIGNNSWTHEYCSHCSKQTRKTLVMFDVNGGEYSYTLCVKCLRKALKLIKEDNQ